ncbi:acyltransferase family protein [Roseivirga pacifica]|uniref:acyltransferase family protein n=1 Tax=Roseivirga pacifica TaxID=1267423 RepID=UPI00209433EC|nr:acyltransferase family protein [Roseivirga pacifica]
MTKIRRYDLDWLRVIVFGLLIFYHVGMFFVPWGWHIKNNTIYPELRWPMLFLNQWRLPILFVISGMGTAFALSYRSGWQFIKERHARLAIPLIFGMLVIVPPQVYIERISTGTFSGSYWEYWTTQSLVGVYPEGNLSWHHLWFLPYLLIFSVILSPVFLYLRNHPNTRFLEAWRKRLSNKPMSIYLLVIPLFLYESLLEPFFNITHNLVWDWFNFITSLTLFFYGYLLISVKEAFWPALEKLRKKALALGISCFTGLLIIWLYFEDSTVIHFTEAALKTTNFWSWILVIFAYAAKYLNRPSRALAYCNRAVYPFYILHQTVTIIIGYWLTELNWPFVTKAFIMVVGTFGACWLLYEFLIKRTPILGFVFGLKREKKISDIN